MFFAKYPRITALEKLKGGPHLSSSQWEGKSYQCMANTNSMSKLEPKFFNMSFMLSPI